MKIFLLFFSFVSLSLSAQTIATYSYKKGGRVKKVVSLNDLKEAYNLVKRSTFSPPNPSVFFNDYLRFKLGVEVALHDKSLISNPKILKSITNKVLRNSFEQNLYKSLAETKLKKKMQRLDKQTNSLSKSRLKALYRRNPDFNFYYISLKHPINPNAKQIKEVVNRANAIYKQIASSKKPFTELIPLYSDDKLLGALNINRSKDVILPSVYYALQKMRIGTISKPIRSPSGYYIVKLNKRIPFKRSNELTIKGNYFNRQRTVIFNSNILMD